jgi:hypothetical protein
MYTRKIAFLVSCALLFSAAGCDLTSFMVKATVDETATVKIPWELWDTDLLEVVIVNNIVVNEGQLEKVPEYEPLLIATIMAEVGYAAMWLDEKADKAEVAGNFDEVERLDKKQGLLFDRALLHAKKMLRLRDDGFDEALHGGVESFEKWVKENFFRKDDAEVTLVAGTAWIATMQSSADGLAAAVDRPFAEALIKRSIELDPELEGARGLTLLGTVECTVPQMLGGDAKKGMAYLERAAKLTDREVHGILVTMAELCAVAMQDRKLFHKLLMEVIESGDIEEYRMVNHFARRKAARLLGQVEDFFME